MAHPGVTVGEFRIIWDGVNKETRKVSGGSFFPIYLISKPLLQTYEKMCKAKKAENARQNARSTTAAQSGTELVTDA
jgi:hypothetical protein